ncbi:MAG: hypothetical protein J7619_23160 [Dyadobacter sp.]|uniref:hypothetical protein n=1 Tax=Dyadobacter sp. TaxID=1914288 RepID=UPI001B237C23|nr:hypothetical protein [Dyadobacter sp.]MBO9615615.1 hypothetical protein [Dyadobacter sp.]
MNTTYLKVGDILFLQKGMMVGCEKVPRKVISHYYSPYDETLTEGRFKLGFEYFSRQDVFEERIEVRTRIIEIFSELKIPLDVKILDRFLFNQIREQKEVKVMLPSGRYVVTSVKNEKGIRWIYCEEMYGDPPAKIFFWQGNEYTGSCELIHNNIVPERGIR